MGIGKLQVTVSRGDVSFNAGLTREKEGGIDQVVDLAAANEGDLTTRTNDTSGVVTADSAEHGITDSNTVNVFWDGGMRYGVTVSSVVTTAITITGGTGDVLPAQGTSVTIAKQVEIDVDWDGDKTDFLAICCARRAHVDLQQSGGSSIKAWEVGPTAPVTWASDTGVTNPVASNTVGKAMASCGESAGTGRMQIGVVYDSVV